MKYRYADPPKWYIIIITTTRTILNTSNTYLEIQTVGDCITHACTIIYVWFGTGCLNRVDNGMIDFGSRRVDRRDLSLKTPTLWSLLEAWAVSGRFPATCSNGGLSSEAAGLFDYLFQIGGHSQCGHFYFNVCRLLVFFLHDSQQVDHS